jgi:thiamine-phosphate pyrophosphorylase
VTDVSHKPGSTSTPFRLPALYPIVDVDLCKMRGFDPVTFARACINGGARLLQVRQKDRSSGSAALLGIVRELVMVAEPHAARILVNDRADIAAIAGAAGVHVGQQDLPPAAVRTIVGSAAVVGVSTHTNQQAQEAAAGPSDYVAVGPFFPTATKDTGYEPRGLDLVRYAASLGKPVVAIGGVTLANAETVLAAGAASVAVISDLLSGDDPAQRVRAFLAMQRG